MNEHPIPTQVALAIRQRFDLMFCDLRRVENTLSVLGDKKSRAILDVLSRAERELGLADEYLRHLVPDDALYASPKSLWGILRTLLKGEK